MDNWAKFAQDPGGPDSNTGNQEYESKSRFTKAGCLVWGIWLPLGRLGGQHFQGTPSGWQDEAEAGLASPWGLHGSQEVFRSDDMTERYKGNHSAKDGTWARPKRTSETRAGSQASGSWTVAWPGTRGSTSTEANQDPRGGPGSTRHSEASSTHCHQQLPRRHHLHLGRRRGKELNLKSWVSHRRGDLSRGQLVRPGKARECSLESLFPAEQRVGGGEEYADEQDSVTSVQT